MVVLLNGWLPTSVIVALTYGLNPRLRKMPGVIVFWLSAWVTIYNIHLGTDAVTIYNSSCVDIFHYSNESWFCRESRRTPYLQFQNRERESWKHILWSSVFLLHYGWSRSCDLVRGCRTESSSDAGVRLQVYWHFSHPSTFNIESNIYQSKQMALYRSSTSLQLVSHYCLDHYSCNRENLWSRDRVLCGWYVDGDWIGVDPYLHMHGFSGIDSTSTGMDRDKNQV